MKKLGVRITMVDGRRTRTTRPCSTILYSYSCRTPARGPMARRPLMKKKETSKIVILFGLSPSGSEKDSLHSGRLCEQAGAAITKKVNAIDVFGDTK